MKRLVQAVEKFFIDTSGATLLEYGILLLIVAAMSVVTIKSIGTKVSQGFQTVNTTLP